MMLTVSLASCTGGCNKKPDSAIDITDISSSDTVDPSGTTSTIPTPKPTTGTSGTTSTSQTSGTSATIKPTNTPKPTETSGTTSTQATNTPTPTTVPTETVADPTSTPEPTATPTEVPVETTPEPTATPTPEPTQDPATVVDYTYEETLTAYAFDTDDYGVPTNTVLATRTHTVYVYMDGHTEKPDKTATVNELYDAAVEVLKNTYGIEDADGTMVGYYN